MNHSVEEILFTAYCTTTYHGFSLHAYVCVCERFRREVGRERERERGKEREIHSLLLLPFQMRQATAKQVASVQKQQQDVGYKTKVVGGVVHRVPIKGVRCHP